MPSREGFCFHEYTFFAVQQEVPVQNKPKTVAEKRFMTKTHIPNIMAFWKNVLLSAKAAMGCVISIKVQHIGTSKINTIMPANLKSKTQLVEYHA